MSRTWDAYDMDPCYGECGGVVIKKMKNINNGKIINISFCNGYYRNSLCIFQDKESPENVSQFRNNSKEWIEVKDEENL